METLRHGSGCGLCRFYPQTPKYSGSTPQGVSVKAEGAEASLWMCLSGFWRVLQEALSLSQSWALSGSHLKVLYWQDVLSPTVTTEPPLPGQSSLLHIPPALLYCREPQLPALWTGWSPKLPSLQTTPWLCECCKGSRFCPQSHDGQSKIIPLFLRGDKWFMLLFVRSEYGTFLMCCAPFHSFKPDLGVWVVPLAQTGEFVTVPCDDSPITIF